MQADRSILTRALIAGCHWVGMTTVTLSMLVVLAGTPPSTCVDPSGSGSGCNLDSDLLVFAEGDKTYEIVANISECQSCLDHGDGTFTFHGEALIEFGPYDETIPGCGPDDDRLFLVINNEILTAGAGGGGPSGTERTYIPDISTVLFIPDPKQLRTACVRPTYLDYEIPQVYLNGASGARSGDPTQSEPGASLIYPELVRAEDSSGLLSDLQLGKFRLEQDLTFETNETVDQSLRLWPEGLPVRLDPETLELTHELASVTTGTLPYAWHPPDASSLQANPSRIDGCDVPSGNASCTTSDAVHNEGYLAHGDWSPQNVGFDLQGFDLDLSLDGTAAVVYETLFPRGVNVELDAPGQITIESGRITGGSFAGGRVWLESMLHDGCILDDPPREHLLHGGGLNPQIGMDGSLLAGIVDLNDNLDPGGIDQVRWSYNEADSLGCGTLFVPDGASGTSPQRNWYQSAVPTVLDRGTYAGLNYNRNRVCMDDQGATLENFCTVDADCDNGAGQTCVDAGFSPRCPGLSAFDPTPSWTTDLEQQSKTFPIDPMGPSEWSADREMAFFARSSGVTGVFDGGDEDFIHNANGGTGFSFNFDTFGLAFRDSQSQGADTIVTGELLFEWPSEVNIPFDEMEVCNCGTIDSARAPDELFELELRYWNQTFYPYGLQFVPSGNNEPCADLQGGTCPTNGAAWSDRVCIAALTPIPRFAPDPDAIFDLDPAGQPGTLTPYSVARLDFDEDLDNMSGAGRQDPYEYHIEGLTFSNWDAAAPPFGDDKGPQREDVIPDQGQPTEDFGYRATRGDLVLPFFGTTAAGIKIERDHTTGFTLADAHTECDESSQHGCAENPSTSYFNAQRVMAAATVNIPFRVDYIRPGDTTTTDDGNDEPGRGRGSLFAFARRDDFDLGAVEKAAGAMIMAPHTEPDATAILHGAADMGPAGAMRLYASTTNKLQLDGNIMPAGHITTFAGRYNAALIRLGADSNSGHTLADPISLETQLHESGAIHDLIQHPDSAITFRVESSPPGSSPPMNGSKVTGYASFAPGQEQLDVVHVRSNVDTGGEFFKADGLLLKVERFAKEGEEPIAWITRDAPAGSSQSMELPGEQSIPFPAAQTEGTFEGGTGFLTWEVDYSMPGFTFESMTGTLDLTKGGFSGMAFDKLGATLKFYKTGDWYFQAGLRVNWDGYGALGDVLLGDTFSMDPLRDIDPFVAAFLGDIPRFEGAYIRAGLSASILNYGCLLRVTAGVEAGGWVLSDAFGGKVRGWLSGTGGCVVSIRGDLTLIGSQVQDTFKVGGQFWVGGGVGFCDPEDWDSKADVLDDDFCAACAADVSLTGTYPPEDLNLQASGPDVDCSL